MLRFCYLKKLGLCLAAFLLLSCGEQAVPLEAVPPDGPSVAGVWAVELIPTREDGILHLTMELEQTGREFRGTWIPDNRPSIVNKVQGTLTEENVLEFQVQIDGSDKIHSARAELDGETMKGQFATEWRNPWSFTASRSE